MNSKQRLEAVEKVLDFAKVNGFPDAKLSFLSDDEDEAVAYDSIQEFANDAAETGFDNAFLTIDFGECVEIEVTAIGTEDTVLKDGEPALFKITEDDDMEEVEGDLDASSIEGESGTDEG